MHILNMKRYHISFSTLDIRCISQAQEAVDVPTHGHAKLLLKHATTFRNIVQSHTIPKLFVLYGQLRGMRLCDPIWLLDVMIEMPGRFV